MSDKGVIRQRDADKGAQDTAVVCGVAGEWMVLEGRRFWVTVAIGLVMVVRNGYIQLFFSIF